MRAGVAGAAVLALAAATMAATVAAPPVRAADVDPWDGVGWTTPVAVSPAGVDVAAGGVWPLADGSLLALWSVADDPTAAGDGPAQVWSRTRTSDGLWGPPEQVSDYQQYFTSYPNFSWDVTAAGAAIVAWTQYDPGTSSWTYRAVSRSSSGAWAAPHTVAVEDTGAVGSISLGGSKAVAVAPDGDATVAFEAREAQRGPGESSADLEVFRTHGSGSTWTTPEEVTVETPAIPVNCVEPDPDDCPDREGPSGQPAVVFDGSGQEWIGWVHREAADEPAEEAGVFLRGAITTQLATGSELEPRSFALAGIDADPAGGVALAWHREVPAGTETWAHAGGDVAGATGLITPAPVDAAVRSIAVVGGRALVVVGVPPAGIDGSRGLHSALRPPGGSWGPVTAMSEDGADVFGIGGRAVLTPAGVPVVGYAHASTDRGRVLAPAGSGWSSIPFSGALDLSGPATVVQSLHVAPDGRLLAGWLSADDGVDRLQTGASNGLPGAVTPPTPPTPPPSPQPPPAGPAALTTVDDGALTRSAGWKRTRGSSYAGGTAVLSKRRGATLTLRRATLSQVGVVVSTCRRCGKVDVFVGRTRIGRVSLKGARAHQQLRLLPAFATRTGKVRVVVASSGRAVRVDGLAIRTG
ncbi:hypothetical protein [Nocardioides sp. L-11A]|uniref:hypothetical protein n=1 Tax=Nocardioides sp. L-11A TaxID=3043848 RepID=UPI00249CBCAC|nr:hypothetical protein QJ852_24635 [Nocardioides sp. L-11A]